MKIIKRFMLSEVKTNCYVIEHENKIILIDAPLEIEKVITFMEETNLHLDYVLLTHTHFDHVGGLTQLKAKYPELEIYCPKDEIELIKEPTGTLSASFGADITYKGEVKDVEEIKTKISDLEISYISGHSLNSAVYHFVQDKVIFSGDTLFRRSIGRSDFKFGNFDKLVSGIKEHILTKDKTTKVYPGHGLSTTVEGEQIENVLLK